jgi:hypothetical protein
MFYEDDYAYHASLTKRNSGKRKFKYTLCGYDPHIRNKNEAEALRKIMSETHLNEDEVLAIKKYRCELSKAQKKQGTKGKFCREVIFILKQILRELKLPKEHPDVKAAFWKEFEERRSGWGYTNYLLRYTSPVNAYETACRNYKK